ncbi:MAG: CinA family protein [Emcibacter sp.]|nr:CinA family protein [Emcibacter sp.]
MIQSLTGGSLASNFLQIKAIFAVVNAAIIVYEERIKTRWIVL